MRQIVYSIILFFSASVFAQTINVPKANPELFSFRVDRVSTDGPEKTFFRYDLIRYRLHVDRDAASFARIRCSADDGDADENKLIVSSLIKTTYKFKDSKTCFEFGLSAYEAALSGRPLKITLNTRTGMVEDLSYFEQQ